jgi:hypothetical protein
MTENSNTGAKQVKTTTIYVNTKEIAWDEKDISFDQLVDIAFPGAANKEFDVTYMKGQSDQEGELLNGDSIHVHPKMEFIVTPTNES